MSKNKLVFKKRHDIGLVWESLAPGYGLLTVMNTFDVVRRTTDSVKWPVGGGRGGGEVAGIDEVRFFENGP